MIRVLWLSFLFLLCYYIVTAIAGLLKSPRRPPPEKSPEGESMVRDPHCGTFVPRSIAFKKVVKGKTYYFCSEECLKRFENPRNSP